MKILITGATGYIGRHLVEFWNQHGHEIIVLARNIDRSLFACGIICTPADVTDAGAISNAIATAKPAVVVHSAAMSKPNDCELNKQLCYDINVKGTQNVIDACTLIDAKLIFMSTDFVFGHHGPYQENDAYCPVNYYGETKVLAEQLVAQSGLQYAIVRTVMVYGKLLAGQNNTFLQWVKSNFEKENPIKVFTDQYRTVTYVNDLCNGIDSIITKNFNGTVHLCGAETVTPHALALLVAQHFGYDEKLVLPATKTSFPEVAMRPENSILTIDRAKEILGYKPTKLADAFKEIF